MNRQTCNHFIQSMPAPASTLLVALVFLSAPAHGQNARLPESSETGGRSSQDSRPDRAAQLADLSNHPKIIRADDVLEEFIVGESRSRVIVNLVEPLQANGAIDWTDTASVQTRRLEVRQRQAAVFSKIATDRCTVRVQLEVTPAFSAEVTEAGLRELLTDPMVASVEPVIVMEPHGRQGLPLMNAMQHRSTHAGAGVSIAIVDTGIDTQHPNLGGGGFPNAKVIGGFDFGMNDADPRPAGNSHGTACAGIAAGNLANEGDYIGGVAYGAKLYSLKISDDSDHMATNEGIAAAWNWCVLHKNDDPANPILIISTSFGGGQYSSICDGTSPALDSAASAARNAGITIFVSSGNDGQCNSLCLPSCLSGVISVGAVYDAAFPAGFCVSDASCLPKQPHPACQGGAVFENAAADAVIGYSNSASFLTLLAPSANASTTDLVGTAGDSPSSFMTDFGGTSAACPYAAGAAAVLQSAARQATGQFLSPAEVKQILTQTGDLIGDPKSGVTKPRVDLGSAIAALTGGNPPPPSQDDSFEPNNDPNSAKAITAGSHALVGNDEDWFTFSMAQAGSLTVSFTAPGGDLDLYVFRVNGSQLELIDQSASEAQNEAVTVQAQAGPVYIRVVPYQGMVSTYNLQIESSAVPPPPPPSQDDSFEPNNDPNSAKAITAGSHALVGNDEDWFTFSMAQAGSLTVSFTAPGGDLDLYVFRVNGSQLELIDQSASEAQNEAVTVQAQAGPVYIRVVPYQGMVSTYNLQIESSAVPPPPPPSQDDSFEPNNDMNSAGVITLGTHQLVGNDTDWFVLVLEQDQRIRVAVSGASGNLDLAIANSQDGAESSNPGSQEQAELSTTSGMLAILVQPVNGAVCPNYTLLIEPAGGETTLEDDKLEENDSPEAAARISAGKHELKGMDEDWFVLTVEAAGTMHVSITGKEGDLDMTLVDANGAILGSSANSGSNEAVEAQVTAGNVFIAVKPYQGRTSEYTLEIVAPEPPPCVDALCAPCPAGMMAATLLGMIAMRNRRSLARRRR